MADNPFQLVYAGLYNMVAAKAPFSGLVKAGNRIRFDGNDRDPLKEHVAAADLPEVVLVSDGMSAGLYSTSSSSMCIRRYSWLISSGDFRIKEYLYEVEWAIFCGMTDWVSVLVALQWSDESFVKRAAIVDVTEGLSVAEQNRGIQGWSSIWRCEVEMHFKTSDLQAELS